MFSGFTAAAIVTQATTFVSELVTPAMVIVGLGVGLGLTGWVVGKLRRAAR